MGHYLMFLVTVIFTISFVEAKYWFGKRGEEPLSDDKVKKWLKSEEPLSDNEVRRSMPWIRDELGNSNDSKKFNDNRVESREKDHENTNDKEMKESLDTIVTNLYTAIKRVALLKRKLQ